MIPSRSMLQRPTIAPPAAVLASVLLLAAGCGGGGDAPVQVAAPCNGEERVCWVSPTGNDANSGASPTQALATINRAAQTAWSGYTIWVQQGTYRGPVTTTPVGQAPKRLAFRAIGRVVVDVQNIAGAAGFSFTNSDETLIDGFTIVGAADAGIVIKSSGRDGSDRFEIRNCVILRNPGDGIRIQDSADVLIFNNLVYNNSGIGIRIGGTVNGSPGAQIINNTVYGNGGRGIEIGTSRAASPAARVVNNIVQDNSRLLAVSDNIKVETSPASYTGYSGNFNLVFPGIYVPSGQIVIRGANDLNVDARFVAPVNENFRLQSGSPAIDAGDPLTDRPDLRNHLLRRSTTGLALDTGRIDMGYHF